jgi:hypothetical protein
MRKTLKPDPKTPDEVFTQRLDALDEALGLLRRPGAQTLPVVDILLYNDPVQSELVIDYQTYGLWFFHEDEWWPVGLPRAKKEIKICDDDEALFTSARAFVDGMDFDMDGYSLLHASAYVTTAGTATSIMIHNETQAVDLLATPITIDSGELDSLDASPAVLATGLFIVAKDQVAVQVDTAGAGAMGLGVRLLYGKLYVP